MKQEHPHVCPDDPGAFFAQLAQVMVWKPDPPPGWEECRTCGGLKLPPPEVPRFDSDGLYLCTKSAPWHPPLAHRAVHRDAKRVGSCSSECCDDYRCPNCGVGWREELPD